MYTNISMLYPHPLIILSYFVLYKYCCQDFGPILRPIQEQCSVDMHNFYVIPEKEWSRSVAECKDTPQSLWSQALPTVFSLGISEVWCIICHKSICHINNSPAFKHEI